MKNKKIAIGLGVVLLLATAFYGYKWNEKATQAKKEVQEFLAALNSANSKLEYSSLSTSGFPFSVTVSIQKPYFIGRIDELFQGFNLEKLMQVEKFPDWEQELEVNGSIDVGFNLLSNKFSIAIDGIKNAKTTINSITVATTTESSGVDKCEFKTKSGASAFDSSSSFSRIKDSIINDLASVDCVLSAGKTVNIDTKELLYSSNGIKLVLSRNEEASIPSLKFYFQTKDYESTKAYDAAYLSIMKTVYPNQKLIIPSSYGKQNTELDFTYNGPFEWQDKAILSTPFEFKINKLSMSTAAYQMNTQFNVLNRSSADKRDIGLALKVNLNGTDLFKILSKEKLSSMIDTLAKSGAVTLNQAELTPEKLDGLYASVIPNYSVLGNMVFDLDVNYKGDSALENVETQLKSFEISAAPYGLNANGSFKRVKENPLPSGTLVATCKNCYAMIDDSVSFINKVESFLSLLNLNNASSLDIPPERAEGFKRFLAELSPTGNDIKFELINTGQGEPTINGKNVSEVLIMFNKYLPDTAPQKQSQPLQPASPKPPATAKTPEKPASKPKQ